MFWLFSNSFSLVKTLSKTISISFFISISDSGITKLSFKITSKSFLISPFDSKFVVSFSKIGSEGFFISVLGFSRLSVFVVVSFLFSRFTGASWFSLSIISRGISTVESDWILISLFFTSSLFSKFKVSSVELFAKASSITILAPSSITSFLASIISLSNNDVFEVVFNSISASFVSTFSSACVTDFFSYLIQVYLVQFFLKTLFLTKTLF